MSQINFYYFVFSAYILIIGVAFLISFIVFYKLLKNEHDKIDIAYIFIISIYGFAIGAKIFNLIEQSQTITITNFINSGYSFVGGLLGSAILVYLYCKKYELKYIDIQANFTIIYPLIYSISKVGCFLNSCCVGRINNCPIQLLESLLMFILFLFLWWYSKNKNHCSLIVNFLILFGIMRFVVDYFRVKRNVILFNFSLSQLCCCIFIIIGVIIIYKRKSEKV